MISGNCRSSVPCIVLAISYEEHNNLLIPDGGKMVVDNVNVKFDDSVLPDGIYPPMTDGGEIVAQNSNVSDKGNSLPEAWETITVNFLELKKHFEVMLLYIFSYMVKVNSVKFWSWSCWTLRFKRKTTAVSV